MKRVTMISQWQGLWRLYNQQFTYSVNISGTYDGIYSMASLLEMDTEELKTNLLQFGGKYNTIANNIIYPTQEEVKQAENYIISLMVALKLQGKGKRLG